MQYSTWSLPRLEQRGRNTSNLLAILLFLQVTSGFWAASAHCWLMFSFSSPLQRTDLFGFFSQSLLMSGIALTQLQSPVFRLVELHKALMVSLLKFVQIPLDGIPSLSCVSCNAQLHIVYNLLRVHSLFMPLMMIFP